MTNNITKLYFDNRNSGKSPVDLPENTDTLQLEKIWTTATTSFDYKRCPPAFILGNYLIIDKKVYNKKTDELVQNDISTLISELIYTSDFSINPTNTISDAEGNLYLQLLVRKADSINLTFQIEKRYSIYIVKIKKDMSTCLWAKEIYLSRHLVPPVKITNHNETIVCAVRENIYLIDFNGNLIASKKITTQDNNIVSITEERLSYPRILDFYIPINGSFTYIEQTGPQTYITTNESGGFNLPVTCEIASKCHPESMISVGEYIFIAGVSGAKFLDFSDPMKDVIGRQLPKDIWTYMQADMRENLPSSTYVLRVKIENNSISDITNIFSSSVDCISSPLTCYVNPNNDNEYSIMWGTTRDTNLETSIVTTANTSALTNNSYDIANPLPDITVTLPDDISLNSGNLFIYEQNEDGDNLSGLDVQTTIRRIIPIDQTNRLIACGGFGRFFNLSMLKDGIVCGGGRTDAGQKIGPKWFVKVNVRHTPNSFWDATGQGKIQADDEKPLPIIYKLDGDFDYQTLKIEKTDSLIIDNNSIIFHDGSLHKLSVNLTPSNGYYWATNVVKYLNKNYVGLPVPSFESRVHYIIDDSDGEIKIYSANSSSVERRIFSLSGQIDLDDPSSSSTEEEFESFSDSSFSHSLSSESSFSSSSSGSSSSTSNPDLTPQFLYDIIAEQGHHNILPFSFSSSEITVQVVDGEEPLSNGFDFHNLAEGLTQDFIPNSSNLSTYIPYTEESTITNNPNIYVDVINAKTDDVKFTSVFVYSPRMESVENKAKYLTPKFSWAINEVEPSSAELMQSIWVSSKDKTLTRIEYNHEKAITKEITTFDSSCLYSVFGENSNMLYVTTDQYIYSKMAGCYLTDDILRVEMSDINRKFNANQDIIVFQDQQGAWSMQTYNGQIVLRDPQTLDIISSFQGLDAPFKILWSKYHQAHIIAGSSILWKLQNNTILPVYSVANTSIIDFGVSDNGKVAIILREQYSDKIRILHNDIFRVLKEYVCPVDQLSYCAYCGNERFYFIKTGSINAGFQGEGILYDGSLNITDISLTYKTQVVVPDSVQTTNPILVTYPNGGEVFEHGEKVNIAWSSAKSESDTVSIELYKITTSQMGTYINELVSVISDSAKNNGRFEWTVGNEIEPQSNYIIKITWLSASNVSANSDFSDTSFVITDKKTPVSYNVSAIKGLNYNSDTDTIVFVFEGGYMGGHNLTTNEVFGLLPLGSSNITSVSGFGYSKPSLASFSKVRIFVGSKEGLSDKWDSGEIETDLLSMYYGGGNNLESGETYYASIQVFDDNSGWSGVRTISFTMPY